MGCLGQSSTANKEENTNAAAGSNSTDKNKILVVVGPSGAGKDSVMNLEVENHKDQFQRAVTHTTREKREGEKEGVDYYFVTKDEFTKMKDNNEFVETNEYNENYYGLSKKELEKGQKSDKICYCIIDINGANAIQKLGIPANFVSVVTSDEKELEKRLQKRATETKEQVKGRLETAKKELKEIKDNALFNMKVVNDNLKDAANSFDNQLKNLYPQLKVTVQVS